MKRVVCALLICLAMLFAAAGSALAAEPESTDRVVVGENVVIGADEVVARSLVVLGGNVDMRGRVNKDLVVLGGSVDVSGRVDGNVLVLGGTVTLEASAVVAGDLSTIGGTVQRRSGSTVGGNESGATLRDLIEGGLRAPGSDGIAPRITPPAFVTPSAGALPGLLDGIERPSIAPRLRIAEAWRPVWEFFRFIAIVLAVMALAALVVSFFPAQLRVMQETMVARFWPALGVGCLTYVVAVLATVVVGVLTAIVAVVLAVSIVGIPLLPIVVGALALLLVALVLGIGLGTLYGFIASARLAGERLLEALDRPASAVVAAMVGVFVLSLVGVIPCIGGLIVVAAASLGLGAAVFTKLGTQAPPLGPVEVVPLVGVTSPTEAVDVPVVTEPPAPAVEARPEDQE